MFSPDRFGSTRTSFGVAETPTGRNFIGLKTAFRPKDSRTPLQKAAHFRFSEPSTPSVRDGRGWRPSDLSDPHKKQLLTELTGRIFHLAASGVGITPSKPRPPASSVTPHPHFCAASLCVYSLVAREEGGGGGSMAALHWYAS